MVFLLDTNVIIDARDGVRSILSRMLQSDGALLVSALSIAELQRGLVGPQAEASVRIERLSRLLSTIQVVPSIEPQPKHMARLLRHAAGHAAATSIA